MWPARVLNCIRGSSAPPSKGCEVWIAPGEIHSDFMCYTHPAAALVLFHCSSSLLSTRAVHSGPSVHYTTVHGRKEEGIGGGGLGAGSQTIKPGSRPAVLFTPPSPPRSQCSLSPHAPVYPVLSGAVNVAAVVVVVVLSDTHDCSPGYLICLCSIRCWWTGGRKVAEPKGEINEWSGRGGFMQHAFHDWSDKINS